MTDAESIQALAALVKAHHGGLEIIASNAAARITKDVLPVCLNHRTNVSEAIKEGGMTLKQQFHPAWLPIEMI